jgi:L-alanine-DL-glutamate epimerase-like enolase superfamily enzyme
MRITDIKAAAVDGHGEWILVQVLADSGAVGLGEAFPAVRGTGRGMCELVRWALPVLQGEDPANIDRLVQRLYRTYTNRGAAHTASTLRATIAGVEIALWDLAGKALNAPVYKLLGGKFRDRIRLYADCHAGVTNTRVEVFEQAEEQGAYTPAAYGRRAREMTAQGFAMVKFDLQRLDSTMPDPFNRTLSPSEIRTAVEQLTAVREAVGPDVEIALDVMSAIDIPSAIRLSRALADLNLLWMEEPVPPENLHSLAQVAAQSPIPICTGENLYTLFQFEELFRLNAAHIVEPDFQKTGLLEGKRIADLAASHYIPVAPHCVATPVGTMASVHLCAALSNFLALEFHESDIPWWPSLAKGGAHRIENGELRVPETPGLGVDLDYDAVREHLVYGDLVDCP